LSKILRLQEPGRSVDFRLAAVHDGMAGRSLLEQDADQPALERVRVSRGIGIRRSSKRTRSSTTFGTTPRDSTPAAPTACPASSSRCTAATSSKRPASVFLSTMACARDRPNLCRTATIRDVRVRLDPDRADRHITEALMKPPPEPPDEAQRLEALRQFDELDSAPDQALDDLARLAALVCATPIAVISVVGGNRQWVKASVGWAATEILHEVSFDRQALLQRGLFVVPDATMDDRFASNPLVTGDPHIRFYAAAPLLTAEGHAVGALCVIDRVPRELTLEQQDGLGALGRQVISQLERRRRAREVETDDRLLQVFRNSPVGLAVNRWADDVYVEVNQICAEVLGRTRAEILGSTTAGLGFIDPEVLARLRARLTAGERLHDVEVALQTRSGEVRHVVFGAELFDLRGEPHSVATFVDITARKQAEEALREHKDRLAAIIENDPEGVTIIDAKGSLLELNRAGLAMLEIASRDAAQAYPPLGFVVPKYRRRWLRLYRSVLGGRSGTFEFEIEGSRGTRRWLETHAAPLRNASGQIYALLGVARDVTERRRAEERIRQLNRVYAVLIDINQIIVRHRDTVPMLREACRIAVSKGGFKMAAVILVDPSDGVLHVAALDGAGDDPSLRAVLAEHVSNSDCVFTGQALRTGGHGVCNDIAGDPRAQPWRADALARDYRSMASLPLTAGDRVIGVLNLYAGEPEMFDAEELRLLDELAADISLALEVHRRGTERELADQARHESETRFRELAENIQEVFWMTDPESGLMLYINPAYEKIWGRPCASLYEASHIWFESLHPEDRTRVAEAAATKQVRGDYDETYRIVRPDGAIRWIHDRAFPVHDANGRVTRVVGTAEDITKQRLLEEQLRQAQKMEAIGQLAGGVAHDFNNLLTIIQGYGSLLIAGGTAQEGTEAVQEILHAADRAANLTRQLLAFSRRQVMQPRLLDLNDIVTSLTKMLQRIVGEDVRIQLTLHTRPLMTRADGGMLDQVLMNLVVNARDAMPGGGQLSIVTSVERITEETARDRADARPGVYVCFSVTDNGSGIADENLDRIFEPFFTTKELGKGTGLGLPTVFGIVKQHDGFVTVNSAPGRGTTFRVGLPAEENVIDPEVEVVERAGRRLGTETVLLVEDEPAVRTLTRVVLERQGYRVIEAANGVEAMRAWRQQNEPVHLLVTDIVMPEGVTGRELASRLRAVDPKLRVIFTSGYSGDIAGRELSEQRGQSFIQKPYSPKELLLTIARCLDS
jgi:PAS domain S-box-containing protein